MISDFELLAAKILCKPKKTLNEGILESIKDRFAQAITDKVAKLAAKTFKNLEQNNPKAASELLEIIQKRDTDKLRDLFKKHNIPQIILSKFGKSKLQQEGIKDYIKGIYQDVDAFLAEFRDTLGLSKDESFINTLVLFYVLGLCLFVGTVAVSGVAGMLILGTPFSTFKDIMVEMMFKSNALDKVLVLLSAGLLISSRLKLEKPNEDQNS